MRKFTQADYEAVKAYERDFTRAIESRYCTGLLQEELEVVQKIYNECLNRQANLSCGGCVLQMMTSVGRLYFGYLRDNPVIEEVIPEDVVKPIEEVTEVITELTDTIEDTTEKVTELIQDDKTEGNNDPENDNPEEPVDVLFQDEKPKKERKPRKSKTNEDKTEHKTGEGMPDAL